MEDEFKHNIRALLKPKAKEEFLKDVKGQHITPEIEATIFNTIKKNSLKNIWI